MPPGLYKTVVKHSFMIRHVELIHKTNLQTVVYIDYVKGVDKIIKRRNVQFYSMLPGNSCISSSLINQLM